MDYYDAENKTFKPLKHSGIQYNRDKQAIEAGMAEAEHQYQLHQASTFKPGLFAHADSQSMVLVKEAEKALIDFCNNTTYTPYSPDSYLSSSQQKQFTELYDKLIIRCEEYINSHKNPRTASGKARKQMVMQIKNVADYERFHILEVKSKSAENLDPEGTWMQLLGALRTSNLDVSNKKIVETGGSTSDVKIIEYSENNKLYYKKEETLHSMKDDLRLKLANNPVCKKHQNVLEKLIGHINEKDYFDMTNNVLRRCTDQSTLCTMLPELVSDFTPKELDELQKILPDFSAAFDKIYTRYSIAAEAKIGKGRNLAMRNVATTRMVNLLGLSGLVTSAISVTLHNSKQSKTAAENVPDEEGVVTVMAKGATISEIKKGGKPVEASPEVVRELINLQILDNLCGQIDRNVSNLFFTYKDLDKKRVLTHVTAIDSDMSFGSLHYTDLIQTEDGLASLLPVEFNEQCTLALMDKDVCERILALGSEPLSFCFADLLTPRELDALNKRLTGLQNLIRKNYDRLKSGRWTKKDARAIVNHSKRTYLSKIKSLISPI